MAKLARNFVLGRMNKSLNERLIPNGEYINAQNIRIGSSEGSDIGAVENTKGNVNLTPSITVLGQDLSDSARCIGAYEDGANETIYWFINDDEFGQGITEKVDLLLSYNTNTEIVTTHLLSINSGDGVTTTLNFDSKYLITGINKVEDVLYFTDNYNPPRQVNVNKDYPNPASLTSSDGFSAESILLIKKPPFNSPSITPISTLGQDNFLEDRFICFAYRYRYADGEYSATSQFSEPSFLPDTFNYSFATALNEGMQNTTNECVVTYNSGGPLVKSVDLLFKDMNSSVIKVIEKLNKSELGLADDTEYTYSFSNSKIFTVLPSSEILRLYDNVPRLAEAQTMMGNRLIYGNYLEGYKLEDSNGAPTRLEYVTSVINNPMGLSDVDYTLGNGDYFFGGASIIADSILEVDLSGIELKAGAILNILFSFEHSSWVGGTPTEDTAEETIDFVYTLPQDFSSVYELASSVDFQSRVGTAANILPVDHATDPTSCEGSTLTDLVNCIIPNELGGFFKYASGISATAQPIEVITIPSSDIIGLQLISMQFVDNLLTPTANRWERYKVTEADIKYREVGDTSSLHSNRGYEVAIIYMDEFKRSTTALVSPNNTVHVPCSASDTKNHIQVAIPPQQVAPEWATSYKFAIKPDKKHYDVIYSNLFFRDPSTGADYFLLDGQNSSKIEEGDELIVKADTEGPLSTCTWTTVLEKRAFEKEFLDPAPVDAGGTEIPVPAGTYMKLRANNFSTIMGELPVVDFGQISSNGSGCRTVLYPVDIDGIDYTIPAGSTVNIRITNNRRGNDGRFLGNTPKKYWEVDSTFTAPEDYDDFKDWFDTNNIHTALEAQGNDQGTGVSGPNYDSTTQPLGNRPCSVSAIYTNFVSSGGETFFGVKSSEGYSGSRKNTRLSVHIEVIRATSTIIFESDPQDAEPDLWYESSTCYEVTAGGLHKGNAQDQTSSIPALVDTAFFNCYSFGNGAESYKIKDSLKGKELVLGNRATTTDSTLYGEERRYSDLTYSGVFNSESNVNKLNEFNAGLLNFKNLEQSFGPVMKLFGRETDILTLQEDKISYVLAGKNLLSDASGGNALTSVPEVLGTQIARIEEFGISSNPESFTQWGADKYFTDAKRGALIQLKGASANTDNLRVISEVGMRTWFRDLFNESFNTQKLGGFDPYMNEFVLSSNDEPIPLEIPCLDCGITQNSVTITSVNEFSQCYNLGEFVGDVDIDYEVVGSVAGNFTLTATYDGTPTSSGAVTTSGTLTFNKDEVLQDEVLLEITSSESVTLNITVNCPDAAQLAIVLVHVNSNSDANEQIHDEYRWTADGYISPLHSEQVTFLAGQYPVVSMFETIVGYQGGGVTPTNGATVTMRSNKVGTDTFNFDVSSDTFKYIRTNTVWVNSPTNIAYMLAASTTATPIVSPADGNTAYTADFTMPSSGNILYLIWDYSNRTALDLCYDATVVEDACCDCE
tara:strand:- start:26621 stop:30994 length:4374 start_codon:yes stop_codon:yes gene_type:complete